jgi:hypothetical protein
VVDFYRLYIKDKYIMTNTPNDTSLTKPELDSRIVSNVETSAALDKIVETSLAKILALV